jgi:DNA-binding response OmpR family regulator
MRPHLCINCQALIEHAHGITASIKGLQWPGGEVRLTKTQAAIVTALLQRPQTHAQLLHLLYGDRVNGGPEDADNVVKTQICKTRNRLSAANFPARIANSFGVGYYLDFSPASEQSTKVA